MSGEQLLHCTRCGVRVRVTTIPFWPIDPLLYVCAECMTPATAEPADRQLSLGVEREETRAYEPTMVEIPF